MLLIVETEAVGLTLKALVKVLFLCVCCVVGCACVRVRVSEGLEGDR